MTLILACECVPSELSPFIEPIEAPLPFISISDYEVWLRGTYIPRTLIPRIIDDPKLPGILHAHKTECWAIFSADGTFERSCQVYAQTALTREFQEYLRGKRFIHNHFSDDSTLSTGEVVAWADLHMEEFNAVTPSRSYSIEPKGREWPNPHQLLHFFSEHPELNNGLLRHRCYELLAEKGLFEYKVTQV